MGLGHLERLREVRTLIAGGNRYDASETRLVCYSGAGFSPGLERATEAAGDVSLVDLAQLYK